MTSGSTRVFYASTLFGALGLVAALDAGQFGDRDGRRILIVSDNTPVPENGRRLDLLPEFDRLRGRFDDVVDWNAVIAPLHPAKWRPPAAEIPMLTRLMRRELGLADGESVDELVLESIAVPPARTIGSLLPDVPVTVYADGLMSYGPTRDELPAEIGNRVGRLLHLDLVPDVAPLLLREYGVVAEPIPDAAFAKLVAELPDVTVPDDAVGVPLVLGQYLSRLDVLTVAEEHALHAGMLRALVARGHRHVAFTAHPAAGSTHVRPLQATARELGVRLTVVPGSVPAETWFAAARPELVVSCFSTGLFTAVRHHGLTAATMGTELVLERLTPYQNSNRIPATLADAGLARLRPDGELAEPPRTDLDRLVRAVGFCMQADRNPDLRDTAADVLAALGPQRYFKKRRLERVGLVPTPPYRSATVRRAGRAGRRVGRQVEQRVAAARGRTVAR